MRALILAIWVACGGEAPDEEGSPPTPPPEPVPAATPGYTVRLLGAGEPVDGVDVAFNDPVDGALLGLATTGLDGVAEGPADGDLVVTFVQDTLATSFFDLPDGAVVDLGFAGTGDQVRGVTIVLEDPFDGAVQYRASAGCPGTSQLLTLGDGAPVYALEPCWRESGTVDVLGIAVDGAGEVIAASTIVGLPIPAAGNGAILPSWTSDLDRVRIDWVGAFDPPQGLATGARVGREGRWYDAGTQFGRGVDRSWTLGLAPSGFGDGVEIEQTWNPGPTYVSRIERRSEVPEVMEVRAADFAPDIQGDWDDETATLSIVTGEGPDDPILTVLGQLQLVDGEGFVRLWSAVGPPERESYPLPELPDDLRSRTAVRLTAGLVSADPNSVELVGRHWAIRPSNSRPPPEVAVQPVFRWLEWADVHTFN